MKIAVKNNDDISCDCCIIELDEFGHIEVSPGNSLITSVYDPLEFMKALKEIIGYGNKHDLIRGRRYVSGRYK